MLWCTDTIYFLLAFHRVSLDIKALMVIRYVPTLQTSFFLILEFSSVSGRWCKFSFRKRSLPFLSHLENVWSVIESVSIKKKKDSNPAGSSPNLSYPNLSPLPLHYIQHRRADISKRLSKLYYYMRNFCNLFGSEQWCFSLIWNTYMWKLQTFCG